MRKTSKNIAIGTLIAAGIGYAAGLLTAPKSGKETRKDVKKAAQTAKTLTEKKLKDLHSELSSVIDQATQQLKKVTGKAKAELEQAVTRAKTAKTKAGDILSAFHEGEADNVDLDAAIKEVKNAHKHLMSFVKHHDA